MRYTIEVQGHRGARGLLPENTLPSFELALDLCVTSIETDVHLTRDDVVVLFHDPEISDRVCSVLPGLDVPPVQAKPAIRSLSLSQVRGYRADCQANPAPMPLARVFAQERGFDPYGIPTLSDFVDFVVAYAGIPGAHAGKSSSQREHAERVILDMELKRVPFFPHTIGDSFSGLGPAILEQTVVQVIRNSQMQDRVRVRSFDHRSLTAIQQIEPGLRTGLLIHNTAPAHVASLLETSRADVYCPDYTFVDAEIVRQVHTAGKHIIPYTVNEASEWAQLIAWGVDGITTDFPDRLLRWIEEHAN